MAVRNVFVFHRPIARSYPRSRTYNVLSRHKGLWLLLRITWGRVVLSTVFSSPARANRHGQTKPARSPWKPAAVATAACESLYYPIVIIVRDDDGRLLVYNAPRTCGQSKKKTRNKITLLAAAAAAVAIGLLCNDSFPDRVTRSS